MAQIGLRWTKLAASLAPSWPKLVRKRPRSVPSSSKLVPRWPKMAPSPFRSEICSKILKQKSRAEAAKEAIGSQARHATENVRILDALAMVRFVENPSVGSTILGGYQRNLNKQGNVQIPVVVRFVWGFSVKVEPAKGLLEMERLNRTSGYPPSCKGK